MKLKRIAALLTAGMLTLSSTAALAAKKNEKKDADNMDVPATYTKVKAKSNAIPGGAGGAMVMKVKLLQQAKAPKPSRPTPGRKSSRT